MKTHMTKWHKTHERTLTEKGRRARELVIRICELLTKKSGREFSVEMNPYNGIYEGHIIDSGKCVENPDSTYSLSDSPEAEPVGMVFFGGHHDTRESETAESEAWESLLFDCIGQSDDVEIREFHNLTRALESFGPKIDFNFENAEKLEDFLKSKDCCG